MGRGARTARLTARERRFWRQAGRRRGGRRIAVGLGQLGHELQRTTQTSSNRPRTAGRCFLSASPFCRENRSASFGCACPGIDAAGLGVRPAAGDAAAHVDVDVMSVKTVSPEPSGSACSQEQSRASNVKRNMNGKAEAT